MSRIPTPTSIDTAPEASRAMLTSVKNSLGSVPNMFRLISHSPAALEGYLALNTALSKGVIDASNRERIALTVANLNRCTYCNSAHTLLGKMAKLSESEVASARTAQSENPKSQACLTFAKEVVNARGAVSPENLDAAKSAGLSDAELVEIVAHVALNTLTNYINEVFKTEVDFPIIALS